MIRYQDHITDNMAWNPIFKSLNTRMNFKLVPSAPNGVMVTYTIIESRIDDRSKSGKILDWIMGYTAPKTTIKYNYPYYFFYDDEQLKVTITDIMLGKTFVNSVYPHLKKSNVDITIIQGDRVSVEEWDDIKKMIEALP